MTTRRWLPVLVLALVVGLAIPRPSTVMLAQGRPDPSRSIGTVTTRGDLILVTLNEGALGRANMFDLTGRTLHFTPEGAAFRAENVALQWDGEFGAEMTGGNVGLKNFTFPYSGKSWDTLSVGVTGSIAFLPSAPAAPGAAPAGGGGGRGGGGVTIGRFDQLQEAARTIINTVPAICVFLKPRMSGTRYVKETADRVVVTWSITEPVGGIQDFTWTPTVNKFQAVLHKDGAIDLSYQQVAAKDAIVGLYPLVNAGAEKAVGTIPDASDPAVPAHLDITSVKLAAVDGLFLKATIETRGPVLPDGDPGIAGVSYQITISPRAAGPSAGKSVVWTIRGGAGGRGGRGGAPRYTASGSGITPGVKVSGNAITVQGMLPEGFKAGDQVTVSAEAAPLAPADAPAVAADRVDPQPIALAGIQSPAIDLASVKKQDGPFALVYESFHYLALPNARDLTCTVINALGDKFDMLAYYSDFRVDNQEAGTPSTGPLGGGPDGGAVTGIGAAQRALDSYCTKGRFQWQFVQPVYAGSNQMQERPPAGMVDNNNHNVTTYDRQLGERMPDGRMPPYNYALSQIGHEMGHRWGAFVSAKVGTETIPLGPTHWARGLHAPVAFPFQRPSEASAMGGGVWQDNLDGTFTQLDDDYYVPATGWSYLDLYLMGLISASEVPDFFILRSLTPAGRDANGRSIFKGDRTKVTIQDVIAVEGPRLPDVAHSQKQFNTGMVMIVEHGLAPSKDLIDRTTAIATRWIDYFATTTGHRASMTTTVK